MIDEVDDDKSGFIEFPEFLKIIQSETGDDAKIKNFFKSMSNRELGNKDLSFAVIILEIKRKNMLKGIYERDDPEN